MTQDTQPEYARPEHARPPTLSAVAIAVRLGALTLAWVAGCTPFPDTLSGAPGADAVMASDAQGADAGTAESPDFRTAADGSADRADRALADRGPNDRDGVARDDGGDGRPDESGGRQDVPMAADAAPPADGGAGFPGHQPGKIYLGYGVDDASCQAGSTVAEQEQQTGATGLARFYMGNITSTANEAARFESSLAAGKLAWISFKGAPHSFAQIAAGAADAELTTKATAYQGVSGPGFITFHHEPSGDGEPADYVAAWNRILDVWAAAGGTGQITPLPILNGFFQGYPNGGNGYTDEQMAEWLPDALIARFRIVGYDGYDAGDYGNLGVPLVRVARKWREWLLRRQAVIADGQKRYLALGETGVFYGSTQTAVTSFPTSGAGEFPDGYPGWDTLWQSLVGYGGGDGAYVAVNYFNSIVNTRARSDWSLGARRPTTREGDLACDSGNEQPPPGTGVADATRLDRFRESLQSAQVADVRDARP